MQRAELPMPNRFAFCCCSATKLKPHREAIVVGDSSLQQLVVYLCTAGSGKAISYVSCNASATEACGNSTRIWSLYSAGFGSKNWPSFWTADEALDVLLGRGSGNGGYGALAARPSMAVVNLAALHLLHLHPAREWWDSLYPDRKARCHPAITCADFRGALRLDSWLASDMSKYRSHLGSDAKIVLATPPSICTAKFHGSYAKWLSDPTSSTCFDWASRRTNVSADQAKEVCERFTFTEAGSAIIAKHFRAAAASSRAVALLDLQAITAGKCNATDDGRHYPSLMHMAATELASISQGGAEEIGPATAVRRQALELVSPPQPFSKSTLAESKNFKGRLSFHRFDLSGSNSWKNGMGCTEGCNNTMKQCGFESLQNCTQGRFSCVCTCRERADEWRCELPPWDLSQPIRGMELYAKATAHHGQDACHRAQPSAPSGRRPSCHTLLFHGRFSKPCLAELNLKAEQLPCVGSLFITGAGGSGTRTVQEMLSAAGYDAEHERHFKETDVLVSWISRTDVWSLSRAAESAYYAGPALDTDYLPEYGKHMKYMMKGGISSKVGLSRCLYRRVLVQVREPLRAITSLLAPLVLYPGYHITGDQLLARSGFFDSVCDQTLLPKVAGTLPGIGHNSSRGHFVAYLALHWWAWNTAALASADDWYRIEGTNLSKICALGHLNVTRCGETERNWKSFNSHGSQSRELVAWSEVCRTAGPRTVRLLYELATKLGYEYGTDAAETVFGCH